MEFEASLPCSQKSNVSPYLSHLKSVYIFTSNFPKVHFADINDPLCRYSWHFTLRTQVLFHCLCHAKIASHMQGLSWQFITLIFILSSHLPIPIPFQLSTLAISFIHNPRMCYVLVIRDPLAWICQPYDVNYTHFSWGDTCLIRFSHLK
jgi:hypothetical protein